ncbi:MAG: DUF2202 domain-containing protein [Anaerolineales bacterium]
MKTKNTSRWMLPLGLILILAIAASACSAAAPATSTDGNSEAAAGNEVTSDNIAAAPAGEGVTALAEEVVLTAAHPLIGLSDDADIPLTEVEIDGLYFMREEEKLARDVYLYLYEIWGSQVFDNIAKSEQSHTSAILTLINFFGLEDPAANTAPGEFVEPDLQALYEQLTAQGSESLQAALLVGAAIEEIDILDIADYIAQTEHEDIILVYQNLMDGSANHLNAFITNLENKTGMEYEPQYLDAATYLEILNSGVQSGGQGNGQTNGNGRNGRP